MAKHRHLSNAPIIEAIIDFRVMLPQDFQVEELSSIRKELGDCYPKVEERRFFKMGCQIKDGKPISQPPQEGLQGYLFKSDDEKNVAQFRIDGFTFSRLKPYTRWEDILDEAKKLWDLYITKASPDSVTRIAVRYINHLNIPHPINNFSEYLEAPPTVPNNLPQNVKNVSSFLTRIVIHDLERDIKANFTQAFDTSGKQNLPIIILDIDVFKQEEFEINNEKIWSTFEQLREMKNQIFFSSITEKTARLFIK